MPRRQDTPEEKALNEKPQAILNRTQSIDSLVGENGKIMLQPKINGLLQNLQQLSYQGAGEESYNALADEAYVMADALGLEGYFQEAKQLKELADNIHQYGEGKSYSTKPNLFQDDVLH